MVSLSYIRMFASRCIRELGNGRGTGQKDVPKNDEREEWRLGLPRPLKMERESFLESCLRLLLLWWRW